MDKILPYAKAVVAVVGAVVTTALAQFPNNATVQQWGPIIASLVTALSVYVVPNKDPNAKHQDESVQPPAEPLGILGKAGDDPKPEILGKA